MNKEKPMFKRLFTISLLLALFASFTMAQNGMHILKPNGEKTKLANANNLKEAIKITKLTNFKGVEATSVMAPTLAPINFTAAGALDTLAYRPLGGAFNTNFGFFGQDLMFTYFQAEADMTIKGIGYTCSDAAGAANGTVDLRIIKLNWTLDQLKSFQAATKQGNYPSIGDGFNEIDPFGEEATANWVAEDDNFPVPPWADNADPGANTWDYDLWSDGGFAWPTVPVASASDAPVYNWLELASTGLGEADVVAGEVFAVVVINSIAALVDDDANRFGFWSDNTLGVPTWKYYENGRGGDGADPGWWVRLYTWDFAVAVDITGDRPPVIGDITSIASGLVEGPWTIESVITDDNPGGGAAGVATADLVYSIDGGDEVVVAMTAAGDLYSGILPDVPGGSNVTYLVKASDVNGNATERPGSTFFKFAPEHPTLLLFNGFATPSGYPQSYYFGHDDFTDYTTVDFPHDVWAYGAANAAVLDNYRNIIEITINNAGPAFNYTTLIAPWIAADSERNYALFGDEWLGALSGWTDTTHVAGEFHYDILGITQEWNDVDYGGDVAIPSLVTPVENSLLGGALYTLFNSQPTDSLQYDPYGELGADDGANFLDGVDLLEDCVVDMLGGGATGTDFNIGYHRELAAGNKVVFLAYDPLSLNSSPEYYWYGFSIAAPQVEMLTWFDVWRVGVDDAGVTPASYELAQNYPNPFNPTTVINYSVPEKAEVTLKVFNLLGQEVATLVNGVQNIGSHQVSFNANNLTSGVYFYTIKAGSFTSTRKMMLIK
jgi:Secretion system C-terminal sorting domain